MSDNVPRLMPKFINRQLLMEHLTQITYILMSRTLVVSVPICLANDVNLTVAMTQNTLGRTITSQLRYQGF